MACVNFNSQQRSVHASTHQTFVVATLQMHGSTSTVESLILKVLFCFVLLKDADKNIIKLLKEKGRLLNASTFKHSYPFCWRWDIFTVNLTTVLCACHPLKIKVYFSSCSWIHHSRKGHKWFLFQYLQKYSLFKDIKVIGLHRKAWLWWQLDNLTVSMLLVLWAHHWWLLSKLFIIHHILKC